MTGVRQARPAHRHRRLATGLAFLGAGVLVGLVAGQLAVRDDASLAVVSRAVAAAGVALLLLSRWLPRRGTRALSWALSGLALCATQNYGAGHRSGPEHPRDFAHYVLGARYFDELGYTHLYECSVAAAQEYGLDTRDWLVRNLETRRPMTAEQIREGAAACPGRFTPQRWAQFSADVWDLHQRTGGRMLPSLVQDHGFNPPPPWLVLAGPIAQVAGPWHGLVWFDTLFTLVAAAAIFRAFGLRAMTLLLLFAGCHAPNQYAWVGGSFFRLDWWAALAVGFAALKSRRDATAGAAFAYAALVRVFPLVIAAGVLLSLVRGGGGRWRKFLAGGLVAASVLCGAALAQHGWPAFTQSFSNLSTHAGAAALNTMGWSQVVLAPGDARMSRIPSQDAVPALEEWERRRAELGKARAPLRVAGVLAACAGWWFAGRRRRAGAPTAWTSVGLVPFLAPALTCYYSIALAFLAIGARTNRKVAVALAAVILASTLVPTALWLDDYYAVQSLLDVQAIALAFFLS